MKLERLTTSADSVAAAVVRGLLEEAGIPVMLRAYQSAGWLFPGTPGSLGAMEVLVPDVRLEQARRVLAEAETDAAAAEVAAAAAGAAEATAAATAGQGGAAGGEGERGRPCGGRRASRSRGATDGPRDRSGAVD
ncbi:MAG: DUF2007 domain-containing protein [Actinobacteria bacterium]|nr:DUF2007 domain-containing protein [Actinomycetota bacterium]